MFVYPYKKGSKSAKALAKSLGCKVLSRPKQSRKGPVINWGAGLNQFKMYYVIPLNNPVNVLYSSNKLHSFILFQGNNIPHPDFTDDIEEAKKWIADGYTVVCRKLLRSHSGKGIVIAKTVNELVIAPLYVKYFPKSYEFRIHVFNGKVIDYVQKKKKDGLTEEEGYNKYIRSHKNGWIFCRENIIERDDIKTLAVNAVKALGLDFGAVDVVMTSRGTAKVLEVNTAPALEGTTLKKYSEAIKEYVNGII